MLNVTIASTEPGPVDGTRRATIIVEDPATNQRLGTHRQTVTWPTQASEIESIAHHLAATNGYPWPQFKFDLAAAFMDRFFTPTGRLRRP